MNPKYTLMRSALDAAGNFTAEDDISVRVEYDNNSNWFEFRITRPDETNNSREVMADFMFSADMYKNNEVLILSKKIATVLNDIKDLNTAEAIIKLLPKQDMKQYIDIKEFLGYFLYQIN